MSEINIKMPRGQYLDLLKTVEMAHEMVASLDHGYKNYEMLHRRIDELEETVLTAGIQAGESTVVDHVGNTGLSEDVVNYIDKVVEDYREDSFWNELKKRLAERDFTTTLTPSERRALTSPRGKFPERAKKIYEIYENEFRQNGVRHLELKKGIPELTFQKQTLRTKERKSKDNHSA
ncbi:MAG: hypothetical protein COV07_02150 [Candidatus Vogelbacteria bacterium CG10_big_fil_rev_8_21_14_0_10_45_14]|uniref:Uncharacterized protein n=1 Tax=Candidatus Vogelbacteria bacterium CG10_big_fil_rev_8_21_14_0_10_45_14 TaxID=1975042 RepID=A0A2H0RLF6_9BACT|nr:MAG: hypothetical protein COV07_02150 [Candidatus Vogelbacteria bacterium CG10_big_fil_rev_8_21_14_0_10_45_14]